MQSGLARRIDSLVQHTSVHAWGSDDASDASDIVAGSVSKLWNQGVRDCIRLELEDGRDIVLTPDHEVLIIPRESAIGNGGEVWRQAHLLQHGDRIVCSTLEGVSDDSCAEIDASSTFALLSWSMQSNRDNILAFSRLCGAYTAQRYEETFVVNNALDSEQLANDIEAVTGIRPLSSPGTIQIAIPEELLIMLHCAGCHTQSSDEQPITVPTFIFDPNCPSSVLREFIAGWWGIQNNTPEINDCSISSFSGLRSSCRVDGSYMSNEQQFRTTMSRIVDLLKQHFFSKKSCIDLHVTYCISREEDIEERFSERESAFKAAVAYGDSTKIILQMEIRIDASGIVPFAERIGVRYGFNSQRWLTASKSYMRYAAECSSKNGGCTEEVKSVKDFFHDVGFDYQNESNTAKRSFALRLMNKSPCGPRPVYDITVPQHHSFVAAGCVVHNCGSRCDALDAVQVLLPYNITVLSLDFSGSGLSDGSYVSLGFYEKQDLSAICEHLWSTGRVSRIGLWGRSMGAATSIMYAAIDQSIAGIVCDSPFTSLEDVMQELVLSQQNWVPKRLIKVGINIMRKSIMSRAAFDIRKNSPIQHASKCFVPALFAHAEGDDFIKIHHSEKLYNAHVGDKNIIRFDGDHNSERPDFFYDSVAIFFFNVLIANSELDESMYPTGSIASKMGVGKETEKGKQISEFEDDIDIEVDSDQEVDMAAASSSSSSSSTTHIPKNIIRVGTLPMSPHSKQVVLPSTLKSGAYNPETSIDISTYEPQFQRLQEEEQLVYAMIESVKDELQTCSDEQRQDLENRLEELIQQAQNLESPKHQGPSDQ